mmetsp:Transcript_19313/g.18453  ORF Transcript_19313/g.18453 Transcript_19313/m.18453 type:complete len:174 (-) Transcript_19313:1095-1616(-)
MIVHCFLCLKIFSWENKPYSMKECLHFLCESCLLQRFLKAKQLKIEENNENSFATIQCRYCIYLRKKVGTKFKGMDKKFLFQVPQPADNSDLLKNKLLKKYQKKYFNDFLKFHVLEPDYDILMIIYKNKLEKAMPREVKDKINKITFKLEGVITILQKIDERLGQPTFKCKQC